MKHYGDITKLNGAELPIVDVITGGSPCQDLSIAGQRKGIAGERSGLFMEQIRIIKEMREHDRASGRTDQFIRPRFMVWENVPGAFSSNKGEDFRAVLEETAKIADKNAIIPRPAGNKWTNSGCIMGDGWSIAWRVHDAQFWGVPQRRKRIALVADFGGKSAPEILFESKGLPGDFEQGGTEREETAGAVGNGTEKASVGLDLYNHTISGDIAVTLNASSCDSPTHSGPSVLCLNDQGGQQMSVSENQTGTLRAQEHGHQPLVFEPGAMARCGGHIYEGITGTLRSNPGDNEFCVYCLQGNGIDRADTAGCNGKGWWENESYTLNTIDRHAVYDARGNGNICPTITGDHENRITDYTAVCIGNGQVDQLKLSNKVGALNCMHDQQAIMTYQKTTGTLSPGAHPGSYNGQDAYNDMLVTVGALCARDYKGIGNQYVNEGKVIVRKTSVVRRLTPLECERLQGYPDGWTMLGKPFGFETWKDQNGNEYKFQKYIYKDENGKIKKVSDSARYKALGNSIALPFWQWMAERIVKQLKDCGVENPTMGSLFDGISGFPLVFARCGAKPLWTSEIEEFPIAVCKAHFGDDDAGSEGDIEKYL